MPKFIFQLVDGTSSDATEIEHDFPSLDDAKREARQTLGEMAREGLPAKPLNMLSVEIFDANNSPLHEVRLLLEELEK